jgi:hypothetical protein
MFPVAAPIPVVIAAAAIRARRRVKRHFGEAGAFSASTAIPFEPGRRMEGRYFRDLVDYGAIVPAGEGLWYLVDDKLEAHSARRRRRAMGGIGAALALAAAAFGASQL